jgi:hypothetical protein
VLLVLVAYRLIAPGAEWHLHREWYGRSTLADLLGADAALADSHKLYRCHDRLLAHKQAVFDHLVERRRDLFTASFDVLLYDLTSTLLRGQSAVSRGRQAPPRLGVEIPRFLNLRQTNFAALPADMAKKAHSPKPNGRPQRPWRRPDISQNTIPRCSRPLHPALRGLRQP